jgi:pSer/pThr/pTyr-binding forkhead associated (FHA) protein
LAFPIVEVLVQLGRGAHNDLVVREDSISDSHAKLQRRSDGWYVVDMQSTNGTFVGGARVQGEAPLGEAAELKFGAIKASFRVAGAAPVSGGKGETAVLSSALAAQLAAQAKAASVPAAPAAPARAAPAAAAAAESEGAAVPPAPGMVPTPSGSSGGGVPAWVWLVVVILVAGGAYFYLQGR